MGNRYDVLETNDTFKETVQEHCSRLKVHSAKLFCALPPLSCQSTASCKGGRSRKCLASLACNNHRHYAVLINKTQCVTLCVSSNWIGSESSTSGIKKVKSRENQSLFFLLRAAGAAITHLSELWTIFLAPSTYCSLCSWSNKNMEPKLDFPLTSRHECCKWAQECAW